MPRAIRRRRFLIAGIVLLGMSLLRPARAQATRRIGVLLPGTYDRHDPSMQAFAQGLRESGYVEGKNYTLVTRSAGGRSENLSRLANDLIAARVDVVMTASSAGVTAAKRATTSVPVVFASAGDPVGQGFVVSLARPGGNITGIVTMPELDTKVLEIIRETLPSARRIGVLAHEPDMIHHRILQRIDPAASAMGFELVPVGTKDMQGLTLAFEKLASLRVDALFVLNLAWFHDPKVRERVAELALQTRLPTFSRPPIAERAGALMSLDVDITENFKRAGRYVALILNGAQPATLPVEQPERYQIVVNLKSAKVLDLAIPAALLLRANRVIE